MHLTFDCPLAKLNWLRPAGIPMVSEQPNLWVDGREMYELNVSVFSSVDRHFLAEIIAAPEVPDWLQAKAADGVVPIPPEWLLVPLVSKQCSDAVLQVQ